MNSHNYLKESSLVYYCKVNMQGEYSYCNRTFLNAYGQHFNLVGASVLAAVDPKDHQLLIKKVHEVLASPGETFSVRMRKTISGKSYWTNWELTAICDDKNEPFEIVCIGLDERNLSESQKRESIFRNAIDMANFIVLIADSQGHIELYNNGFKDFIKNQYEVIKGKNFISEFLLKGELKHSDSLTTAQILKSKVNTKLDMGWNDGDSKKWLSIEVDPILDPTGNVEGYLLLGLDLTEKRVKDEELLRNFKLLQEFERIGKLGGYIHNLENNKLELSNGAKELMQLNKLKGDIDFNFLKSLIISKNQMEFTQFANDSASNKPANKILKLKLDDGTFHHFNFLSVPFNTDLKESAIDPIRIGVIKEITSEVEQLKKIQKQNLKLEQIAWTQAHELRRPLSNILGLVSLYESDDTELRNDHFFEMLKRSSNDLDVIIKSIVNNTSVDNN